MPPCPPVTQPLLNNMKLFIFSNFFFNQHFQQDQSCPKMFPISAMTSQTHSMQGFPAPRTSSIQVNHSKDKIQSVAAAKISLQQVSQSEKEKSIYLLKKNNIMFLLKWAQIPLSELMSTNIGLNWLQKSSSNQL